MKYWLDTEFIEDGKTIDLISIGLVCEDGREYYAINRDCDFRKASNWVLENVLNPIGLGRGGFYAINPSNPYCSATEKQALADARSKREIMEDLLIFFAPNSITDDVKVATRSAEEDYAEVEIWAYYADYDWVVFCQLFGTMMDLPKGFPKYCRDIKQECDRLGNPELPKQGKGEHNALADAQWNKHVYDFLAGYDSWRRSNHDMRTLISS